MNNKKQQNFQKQKQKQKGNLSYKSKQRLTDTLWKFFINDLRSDQSISLDTYNSIQLLENYVKLPVCFEKIIIFGLLHLVTTLIKWIIIIPIRWIMNLRKRNTTIFKNDTIAISSVLITLFFLIDLDTSKIYHNIRSSTIVKLYFMIQVLEITDKLLSSTSFEIMSLLYNINYKSRNFVFIYLISIAYMFIHSYVLVYQIISLNIAINSYSNALLTIILSNHFSKLKTVIFKKIKLVDFLKILFHDLNKRFLIFLMLIIILSRNFIQILINYSNFNEFFNNIKPHYWSIKLISNNIMNNWIGFLIVPSILLMGSELIVDWIKHVYMAKFNKFDILIYKKFLHFMALEFVQNFNSLNSMDYSNIFVQKVGVSIKVISIIFYKLLIFPFIKLHFEQSSNKITCIILIFLVLAISICWLILIRLLILIVLLNWSKKILVSSASLKNREELQEFEQTLKAEMEG